MQHDDSRIQHTRGEKLLCKSLTVTVTDRLNPQSVPVNVLILIITKTMKVRCSSAALNSDSPHSFLTKGCDHV